MIESKAPISNVTVFRNGARITRKDTLNVEPGPVKIRIEGITPRALQDSFRVSGSGNARVSAMDVARKEKVVDPEDNQFLGQLIELRRRLKSVQDLLEIQNLKLSSIQQLTDEFSDNYGMILAANEASLEQLDNMDSKTSSMKSDARKKIRTLHEERKDIESQIDILESKMGEIASQRSTKSYYDVEIVLEAEGKESLAFELTYQSNHAGWVPSYDVNIEEESCSIRRIALVKNNTEEDWDDVGFRVSTASARPAQAIEGTPWYIRAFDPNAVKARRDRRKRGMKMAAGAPAAKAEVGAQPPPSPPPEMEEAFAKSSEKVSGISVYDLPDQITIPADREEHPITLIEEDLESSTRYYWNADEMATVVAQEKVVNGSSVLLPGEVRVFEENNLVGETTIPQISPREEFEIGTRIANNVKGNKKLKRRRVEKSGITRGKVRQSYAYELTIENFAKKSIEILVKDRTPHSTNPSIEVERAEIRPQPDNLELGILEWNIAIDSNTTSRIEYAYSVTWDRDLTISPPLP